MSNRRKPNAQAEGGRNVRPLALIGRVALALAVLTLLMFALHETTPEQFQAPSDQEAQTDESGVRQIDWDSLPDEIVAWVEVPGTNIDEPIAQASPSYPNQYLYVDVFGQGAYGTPYIDCDCSVDSPFVIVYGHHMSDGSVFADFSNFIDREYAEAHKIIYVYTRADNERHELEVCAVDVVNAYREFIQTRFNDDEERVEYLQKSISRSDLVMGEIEVSDKPVWAFATCSYQTSNSRTAVYSSEVQSSNLVTVPVDGLHG